MIIINLLPPEQRSVKRSLLGRGIEFLPLPQLIGCSAIVLGLIILVHTTLTVGMVFKNIQLNRLKTAWTNLQPEKKNIDEITSQLTASNDRIASIINIQQGEDVLWSKTMNTISDSIPKGLWLKRVVLKDGMVTIDGSAVSKNQNEMLIVGEFVKLLKSNKEFADFFESVEVGLIQRRKDSVLAIADFSLLAKLK